MMKITSPKSIIVILALVAVLAVSLTGCLDLTGASPTATTTSPASPINPTWTTPAVGTQVDNLPAIADVVALVKPAVVAINTEIVSRDIFGSYTQEGAGSGWIIDSDGIIVTNYHVIEDAQTITVTLDDGRTFTADPDSIYTDSFNDLAIFSIDATDLPALEVGSSSALRVGDWVVAIGNALGLGIRATEGIVSRQGVELAVDEDDTLYDLLEITAVINAGNSGGPLVNMAGEVVGITSAKIAQVGVEGMGYAISIDTAIPIIQQLVNQGYVTRPYMGVSIIALTSSVIAAVARDPSLDWDISVDQGILVYQTVTGRPADSAGLQPGDVIVEMGGVAVPDEQTFMDTLHGSAIGQPLEVVYYRGDAQLTTTVYPIETPAS